MLYSFGEEIPCCHRTQRFIIAASQKSATGQVYSILEYTAYVLNLEHFKMF